MPTRLTDARIGDERLRDFVIYFDSEIADLTALEVYLHRRKQGETEFFTVRSDRETTVLYVKDPINGIVTLAPDSSYWDEEGDFEMYFEIVADPPYFSPSSEMMLISVKSGVLKESDIVYVNPITCTMQVKQPTVVVN